jgi:hypothetical protein
MAASREAAAEGASSYQPQVQMHFKVMLHSSSLLEVGGRCRTMIFLPNDQCSKKCSIMPQGVMSASISNLRQ